MVEGVDAVVNLSGAIDRPPPVDAGVPPRRSSTRACEPTRRPRRGDRRGRASARRLPQRDRPSGIYGDRPGETLDRGRRRRGDGLLPGSRATPGRRRRAIAAGATRRRRSCAPAVVVAQGRRHDADPAAHAVRARRRVRLAAGSTGRGSASHDEAARDPAPASTRRLERRRSILAGPTPATSDEITEAFAARHAPPAPAPRAAVRRSSCWARPGATCCSTMHEVVPAQLQADGFVWKHPTIDGCGRALVE